jgi:hypothetical protein
LALLKKVATRNENVTSEVTAQEVSINDDQNGTKRQHETDSTE